MVKELMKIVDKSTKAEDTILFITEKTQSIKRPHPRLGGDKAKAKRKKNAKGTKGKKNNYDEVFVDLPDTHLNKLSKESSTKYFHQV